MLTRALLILLLLFLLARALWRLVSGIVAGASAPGPDPPRSPTTTERMVRDPVCGTFVLPSRALSLRASDGMHYFCSERCRGAYDPRAHAS